MVTGSKLIANLASDGAAIYNGGGSTLKVGTTLFLMNPPDNIDGPWTDLGGDLFVP